MDKKKQFATNFDIKTITRLKKLAIDNNTSVNILLESILDHFTDEQISKIYKKEIEYN